MDMTHVGEPMRASPYWPLDNAKDEIRLITIEPLLSCGLVRCYLSTASLKDFTPEYQYFIQASGLVGQSARRVLPKWTRYCHERPQASSDEADAPFVPGPVKGEYWYLWGDFAALSYTWGEEKNPASIFLNGTRVLVTKNLEIVLRTLATNGEFGEDYRLWIDAVCINQNDEAERAVQVQKMRDIYCGAWSVMSWVGKNDETGDVKDAFRLLRTLSSLPEDQLDLSNILVQRPGLIPQGGFFALHELMKRPYWTRLWVVQELVMGASFTIVRCDDELLDLESLCKGISVLYRGSNWSLKDRLLANERNLRHLGNDPAWYHIQSLHLLHQAVRELIYYESTGIGTRLGFRRLLQVAHTGQCREVRDKVFALLGLIEPEVAETIALDHNRDPRELFAAIAKAFITHTNSLESLRLANPWGGQQGPTWAADWTWEGRMPSWRPGTTLTGSVGNKDPSIVVPPKPETIYNADSKTPPTYKFFEDWRYLQCEGFVIDTIGGLGASERNLFEWDAARTIQYPSWKSAYGGRVDTSEALYGALLGHQFTDHDSTRLDNFALSSLPSTFCAGFPQFKERQWKWLAEQGGYYYKWEHWREAHNDFMLGDQPLSSFFTDVLSDAANESTYVHVYCNVREMVMERRFMLTKRGYLGWAPDNVFDSGEENHARVGDLVAIVLGCSTPLIIRPRGKSFELVGEAYVQGFMDGEALKKTDDDIYKVQSFCFG